MRKSGIQEGRNGGDGEGLRARPGEIRLEFNAEGGEDAEKDKSIEQKARKAAKEKDEMRMRNCA